MNELPGNLNPRTQERLRAMLPELRAEVRRAARARRRRRAATAAMGVVAIVIASAILAQLAPRAPVAPSPQVAVEPARAPMRLTFVRTDPAVLERARVRDSADLARYAIDDDQLLETLAALDRPAGLVRTREGVSLTAPVTDAELAPGAPPG